jgi:MscS family membrane protein
MSSCRVFAFISLAFLFLSLGDLKAQDNSDVNASPYSVVYNHLYHLQADTYDRSQSAKSFYGLDSLTALRKATKLKQIFDGRGYFINVNEIPKDTNYLDSINLSKHYVLLPEKLPQVYLEQIDGKWYYSPATIKVIDELHKETYPFGAAWLMNLFDSEKQEPVFFKLKPWQLIGFGFIFIILLLSFWVLNFLTKIILNKLSRFTKFNEGELDGIIKKGSRILSLLFLVSIARWLLRSLLLHINFSGVINKGLNITAIVLFALLAVQIANWLIRVLDRYFDKTESRLDNQSLPILERMAKIIIVLVALLNILYQVGVNITALLAGISIGGLALALAAQDTVKHLIGSIMIFVDRPFQIGDYIIAHGEEGTVEEVGFRTTRLRKVDSTINIIPNGKLADGDVTNYGPRKHRLFQLTLGVEYTTSRQKLSDFIQGLKSIIEKREEVYKETYFVNLRNLSDSSIDILFRCYINTDTFAEELNIKEEMIFEILELTENLGVSFAYPSMKIYKG